MNGGYFLFMLNYRNFSTFITSEHLLYRLHYTDTLNWSVLGLILVV